MLRQYFEILGSSLKKLLQNWFRLILLYIPFHFLYLFSYNPKHYIQELINYTHKQGLNLDWLLSLNIEPLPLKIIFESIYYCTLFIFIYEIYQNKKSSPLFKFKWPAYDNYYLVTGWTIFFISYLTANNLIRSYIGFQFTTQTLFLVINSTTSLFLQLITVFVLLAIAEDTTLKLKPLTLLGQESRKTSILNDLTTILMESLTKSSKLIKKEGFKIVVFLLLTFILIRLMYLFIETPYTLSYLFLSDSKDYQWIVTSWSYFTLVCQSILHPIFYFVLFEYQLGEHEKNIR